MSEQDEGTQLFDEAEGNEEVLDGSVTGAETTDDGSSESGDGDGEASGEGGAAGSVVSLSPETIAAIAAASKPAAAATPQPQMSPEQVRELLGQFEMGEADLEALGLPPAAAQHLNDFKERIVRQSVRTMAVQMEHMRRQLEATINPIKARMEQQQLAEVQKQFYTQNKDLQGADAIVEAVYSQLQKTVDFSKLDMKQSFKLVADEARRVKAKLIGGNGQQLSARRKPTMLSGGRTGGKGGRSNVSEAEKQALAIFG